MLWGVRAVVCNVEQQDLGAVLSECAELLYSTVHSVCCLRKGPGCCVVC